MWRLLNSFRDQLRYRFARLYGQESLEQLMDRLALIAGRYSFLGEACSVDDTCWDQRSVLLITYGDMVQAPGEKPLHTLERFLEDYCADLLTGVHVLPFFPSSSDEGFAVIDYRRVDPELGDWDDIEALGQRFHLAVDLVLNHVSRQSRWFENYISGIAPGRDFFIEVEPGTDLSAVVRPRTSPLLTTIQTVSGPRSVWSTFSPDQIDLDYRNPDVLLEMIDILLWYISHRARIIRLDAVAYIWKEFGTSCVALPQTHEIVALLRLIVDHVAPGTLLLAEAHLPHAQNIRYFGKGDEAQLLYQFSLPPLLLLALIQKTARHLRQWAASLEPPPPGCTFVNFTASHDGIGLRPLEGLASSEEIDCLVSHVLSCGGLVSSRQGPEGQQLPYELNTTYFDALKDPEHPHDQEMQIRRFLCSQIIMLVLPGIPAFYFHSLTASGNDREGVALRGTNRAINRGRWQDSRLRALLADSNSPAGRVMRALTRVMAVRRHQQAFHPDAPMEVLESDERIFALIRGSQTGQPVVCLHNLSSDRVLLSLAPLVPWAGEMYDLLGEQKMDAELTLGPYQCCWLVGRGDIV